MFSGLPLSFARNLYNCGIKLMCAIQSTDGRLMLPPDLQNLYAMYQQEIQAATYVDSSLGDLMSPNTSFGREKLPPISSRLSYDNLNNDMRIASR